MSYAGLQTLVSAVATNAGVNPGAHAQTAYTAIGTLEAARRAGPPRVTWVPVEETAAAPTRDESLLSKTAFVRQVRCDVRILGQDYAQAEIELHAFLGALSRTQPLVVRPLGGPHNPETLTGANRYEIVYGVEVDIPVYHETYTAGLVTGTAHVETVTDP